MTSTLLAVGSLDALREVLRRGDVLDVSARGDVVAVTTAAAFVGVTEAAVAVAQACGDFDLSVEALVISDRASTSEAYFARRINEAQLVVLCDGSPLHARAVWRDTPVGEAIHQARQVVAVGSVATVLCEVMVDPRGGAPTTGLGYVAGVALALAMSEGQMLRTRSLVAPEVAVVAMGPSGVVRHDGSKWSVVEGDVVVTRGQDQAQL